MKKINLGILTFPISESGTIPLSNLIEISIPISNKLTLVTGGIGYEICKDDKRFKTYEVKHDIKGNILGRALEYLYTQLKISYKILKIKDVEKWIFFIGGDTLVLPMLTAKIFRKKVYILFAGSSIKTLQSYGDNFYKIAKILSKFNCKLTDEIIVYSENIVSDLELEHYKQKIIIAHEHIINFDEFQIKKGYDERDNLIGYIGRLSAEKGVMNFIESIPLLLKVEQDLEFLVCGTGILREKIKDYIEENKINDKVIFLDGISHDEVPIYLNKLKLLVLPSFTEGLPNIMIEAMACGTPVLATSVGAIPDIIKDGINGFIIEENSPKCICENVINIMEKNNLQEVIDESHSLVNKKFSYDNTLCKWKEILNQEDMYE